MKKTILGVLLITAMALPVSAQTVTGPQGGKWTGGFGAASGPRGTASGRAGTASGPHGGTASGASGTLLGPNGAAHGHVGTATGPNGSTTSVARGFAGNRSTGVAGGARTWSGPNSSGSARRAAAWNNGTYRGGTTATVTNKKTGVTSTDSSSVDYNKNTGGDASITTAKGTKTKQLPPAP